jgi:hypothetical protein
VQNVMCSATRHMFHLEGCLCNEQEPPPHIGQDLNPELAVLKDVLQLQCRYNEDTTGLCLNRRFLRYASCPSWAKFTLMLHVCVHTMHMQTYLHSRTISITALHA